MANVEPLLKGYEQFVRLPWPSGVAGPEKVWMAVYDETDERRLRTRIGAFENATVAAGHKWLACDLSDLFAKWMTDHEYHESYFRKPARIEMALEDFFSCVVSIIQKLLADESADENTVVAMYGVASLFGLVRVSRLIDHVSGAIQGRLLVLFPGERDGSNFRLLDARDGWNYLAIPITGNDS